VLQRTRITETKEQHVMSEFIDKYVVFAVFELRYLANKDDLFDCKWYPCLPATKSIIGYLSVEQHSPVRNSLVT